MGLPSPKIASIFIFALIFYIHASICAADVLTLNDGTVLNGDVISESPAEIRMNCKIAGKYEIRSFARSTVKSIVKTPMATTSASKKTPSGSTPPPSGSPSASPTAAEGPTTIDVIAGAIGTTREKAIASAQVTAVEQALGRLIDAEAIIENDVLIRDTILSATNGFIERFTFIEDVKEGAMFRVRIRATVRSGKLSERLSAITKDTSAVEGGNLQAEARTKAKSREEQIKMLQATLETVTDGVMGVRVTGKFEVVEGVKVPTGMTRLRIPIELFVDQAAYETRMARLIPLLEEFAKVKKTRPIRMLPQKPITEGEPEIGWNLFCGDSIDSDSKHTFPTAGTLAAKTWFAIRESDKQMWDRIQQAEDVDFVENFQKDAKEDLVAFQVVHDVQPSGAAELSVYGLPLSFASGVFKNYSGTIIVRIRLQDSKKLPVASVGSVYQAVTEPSRRSQGSSGSLSVYFGIAVLLGGFDGFAIDNHQQQRRGILYLNPGLYQFYWGSRGNMYTVITNFYGYSYIDIDTEALARVASVECTLEMPKQ